MRVMTKAFVLIFFTVSFNSGGAAAAEFESQAACEAARATVVKEFRGHFQGIHAICVPKG